MAGTRARFASMLKEHIAPSLREMGFKGSGQRYTFPHPAAHVSLGFDRSHLWTDPEHVCFRLMMSIVGLDEWEAARAERPDLPVRPRPYEGPPAKQFIGIGLPRDRHWWVLASEASGLDASPPRAGSRVVTVPGPIVSKDEVDLARQVLDAIRDHVIPRIQEELRGE